ncbi:evolutionarily conserved C-terminal region 5, partial [Striga asiatica]
NAETSKYHPRVRVTADVDLISLTVPQKKDGGTHRPSIVHTQEGSLAPKMAPQLGSSYPSFGASLPIHLVAVFSSSYHIPLHDIRGKNDKENGFVCVYLGKFDNGNKDQGQGELGYDEWSSSCLLSGDAGYTHGVNLSALPFSF